MRMKLVTSFIILMNNVFNSVQQNNVERASYNSHNKPQWHSNEDDKYIVKIRRKRAKKKLLNLILIIKAKMEYFLWKLLSSQPANEPAALLSFPSLCHLRFRSCLLYTKVHDKSCCIYLEQLSFFFSLSSNIPSIASFCGFNSPPIRLLIVNMPNRTIVRICKISVCIDRAWNAKFGFLEMSSRT